jgi:hypothetical protein
MYLVAVLLPISVFAFTRFYKLTAETIPVSFYLPMIFAFVSFLNQNYALYCLRATNPQFVSKKEERLVDILTSVFGYNAGTFFKAGYFLD